MEEGEEEVSAFGRRWRKERRRFRTQKRIQR